MDNNKDILKKLVIINYALQGSAILLGGIPGIVAIIIAYIKKEDAKGTWLYSHFEWQITTFWIGFIVAIIGLITIFIGIGFVILAIDSIWIIYRIIKGVLYVLENKSI
jgi:uncharacterized membrane protein